MPSRATVFRPAAKGRFGARAPFERIPQPQTGSVVRRVVVGAFGHRRKTLANALSLAGVATREQAVAALAAIERRPDVRAEALEPDEFVELAKVLRRDRLAGGSRPAKLNLALVVGPRRADGKHEVVTLLQRLSLVDTVAVRRADSIRVTGFEGDTLVRAALAGLAAVAPGAPCFEARIEKRDPGRSGAGGGSSDAATALWLANHLLDEPLAPERSPSTGHSPRRGRPVLPHGGSAARDRRRDDARAGRVPAGYDVAARASARGDEESTRAVYAAFDDRDGHVGFETRSADLHRTLASLGSPEDLARLPPNDLASSPLAAELRELGAFRADVTGAGPVVYGLFGERQGAQDAADLLTGRAAAWLGSPLLIFSAHGGSDRHRARREPFRAAPAERRGTRSCSRSPRSRASSWSRVRSRGGWSSLLAVAASAATSPGGGSTRARTSAS